MQALNQKQESRLMAIGDEQEAKDPRSLADKQDHSKCCEATCLLVDDNLLDLIPLELMLDKMASIKVFKASSGPMAIKLFKEDRSKTCCSTYHR